MKAKDESVPVVDIRLLGPMEVWHAGKRESLPRSKKSRALLAYLAMSGHEHTRSRLCDLFWDVTDDRRGALRWSLSRLRKVVDHGSERIHADRERVSFVAEGARVDALELGRAMRRGVGETETEALEQLATLARGEFLEGLELPDFFDFQAWCVTHREEARQARCAVLKELVGRLGENPQRALVHARSWVHADALNVAAHVELLSLLLKNGRTAEAKNQLDLSRRSFREVDAPGARELDLAWRDLSAQVTPGGAQEAIEPRPAAQPAPEPPRPVPAAAAPAAAAGASLSTFVGRQTERDQLLSLFEQSRTRGSQRVALITGEPGAGKSRLAELIIEKAREAGAAVLEGRAFEAESKRAYGPWVDALKADLAELTASTPEGNQPSTRDTLFSGVADLLATTAAAHNGALLLLDDVQWLERDSAELLHYVARSNRQRPVFILLLARSGELADNEHMLRVLRSLRREVRVEEVPLEPLTVEEVGQLVARFGNDDATDIYEASAGNPLYALELARAGTSGSQPAALTLTQLVRERIERLPGHATDVLRWGAVLGHSLDVQRLGALSSLDQEELVDALERLEQHELLRSVSASNGGKYAFAHDIVRQAVYGELSHPRRRLMHQQVAKLLQKHADPNVVATEVAHHASLAGDAMLGVRACIVAGQGALRLFANGDADALARRGLSMVTQLENTDRIASSLELLHVQFSASTPERERAASHIRALTEEALDAGLTRAARLGFQMLSYLRWEHGSMALAHDNIMRAERISRSADPEERTVALSQAAKCLLLLERDMSLAEAFLLEADALATRSGNSPSAMQFATGMLHEHRGAHDEARAAFESARQLGREEGDRLAEFGAIEHLMMLELDLGRYTQAHELVDDLIRISDRVRDGAEGACGRALSALAKRYANIEVPGQALPEALSELRILDSKYRLAYVLTRLGRLELASNDARTAQAHAEDALRVATEIGRASEIVLARVLLARTSHELGNEATVREQVKALQELVKRDLSAHAKSELESTLAELGGGKEAATS